MPEANSDHIVAVLQRQRDQFFNALTVAEINNAALTARVAELEAENAAYKAAPPVAVDLGGVQSDGPVINVASTKAAKKT